MPVLGMMSVFDWSEADNVKGGWTGREWFVVNKAWLLVRQRLAGSAKIKVTWIEGFNQVQSGSIRFNQVQSGSIRFNQVASALRLSLWSIGQARSEAGRRQHFDPKREDGRRGKNPSLSRWWPRRFRYHQQESSSQDSMFCLWLLATQSFSKT